MHDRFSFITSTSLALLIVTFSAYGWGYTGHRIVGEIAETHLTPEARKGLAVILQGDTLARLSTWPDEIRGNDRWDHAKPWHYVSIDDEESFETFERAPEGDVMEAIERMEKQVVDSALSRETRWQALAFYVHFVGDIHQPLHVGRRDDLGGNTVVVNWFGEHEKLHKVWDTLILDRNQRSYTEFAKELGSPSAEDLAAWKTSTVVEWASESRSYRDVVYQNDSIKPGGEKEVLGEDYVKATRPIVEKRLQQAGFRLAARLNAMFANPE